MFINYINSVNLPLLCFTPHGMARWRGLVISHDTVVWIHFVLTAGRMNKKHANSWLWMGWQARISSINTMSRALFGLGLNGEQKTEGCPVTKHPPLPRGEGLADLFTGTSCFAPPGFQKKTEWKHTWVLRQYSRLGNLGGMMVLLVYIIILSVYIL